MDNIEAINESYLKNKYLEDNARFNKGDVVYYEYVYNKDNQQRVGVSVGIVVDRGLSKRVVPRGDKSYTTYDIVYSIVNPHGSIIVHECKCTSISEYIFREYLKRKENQSE